MIIFIVKSPELKGISDYNTHTFTFITICHVPCHFLHKSPFKPVHLHVMGESCPFQVVSDGYFT